MRHSTPGLTLAGIATLLIVACGGGGGSGSSSSGGTPNVAPVANAGAAQTVTSGATVTLNGTASSDSDGTIAVYTWSQTAGATVSGFSNPNASQPTFPAPSVTAVTTLTFSLVVSDNRGANSTPSTVSITVNPVVNAVPVANAGTNQTVLSGATVTLDGTASSDSDGSIGAYLWSQTLGPIVTLTGPATSRPTFVAPTVTTATALAFSLTVSDNRLANSIPSTVSVTVNPVLVGNVAVTGAVTFRRVLIATSTQDFNRGLLYQSPVSQPSRGVVVRARNASQAIIATGVTDSLGNYSLSVPNSTAITIEVVARLLRDSAQPLPHWNMRVQNGTVQQVGNIVTVIDNPYSFSDGVSFNSGGGTTHNVLIPTGLATSGPPAATGTRASGPFAILDTLYQGIETIRGVAPDTEFPELIVDWGSQSLGTFFTSGPQHIALLSNLARDTDEFDQHVIAHEFGHYIEFNFSRADNVGGSHAIGEKVDPRLAFGEGFGYAFAAIVLNSPDARDTATDNGDSLSTGFNIETNPQTSPVGAPGDDYGCWCSESSVYSILWDLFDSAADANDNVALGFGPLWSVLTGAQKTTPAFTTIFPFITALKAARPSEAGAITTLVAAQNIDGTDAFGAGETHVPTGIPSNAVLPLFTTIPAGGGSVVLRTVNDFGVDNKLGNHRLLRFTPSTSRDYTITLATTNSTNDPDFIVRSSGNFVLNGTSPPPGPESDPVTLTAGTTYVLDVYDCDNGCSNSQVAGGDFDLTVTIN